MSAQIIDLKMEFYHGFPVIAYATLWPAKTDITVAIFIRGKWKNLVRDEIARPLHRIELEDIRAEAVEAHFKGREPRPVCDIVIQAA